MKQFIYSLLIGLAFVFTACEDDFDEKHKNPDGFTDAEIDYLFTRGALNAVEIDYGDTYNYNFRLLGVYTQVTARRDGANRLNLYDIQNDKGMWENYYVKRMSTLTEMDRLYKVLSDEEKQAKRIFIEAAKVMKAYNTAIATDFFGNMPYSEAFTARNAMQGEAVIFTPKYDSQQDIYYTILDDLKTAADYFKSAQTTNSFDRQDIIYHGNTARWAKFANSLRLRYAMRISNVDEAKAKEVISSLALSDLITSNADNACIMLSLQTSTVIDAIWRAMKESHNINQGYHLFAPEKMVNMQKEAGDPRLPVMFQRPTDDDGNVIEEFKDSEFIGYPASADKAIATMAELEAEGVRNKFAVYNTVTYRKNYALPVGVGITAAEVYFLLAEAAARGIYSGSAEEFYNKGVITSIQNYYAYYTNSTEQQDSRVMNTDVSTATLSAWLAGSTYKYDSSKALEQIATQKWMHTGILQIYETYAEYRRTDFPLLDEDRENGTLLNLSQAPVRLMYPAKEASMNTENYNAQSQYNDPKIRLWWDVK